MKKLLHLLVLCASIVPYRPVSVLTLYGRLICLRYLLGRYSLLMKKKIRTGKTSHIPKSGGGGHACPHWLLSGACLFSGMSYCLLAGCHIFRSPGFIHPMRLKAIPMRGVSTAGSTSDMSSSPVQSVMVTDSLAPLSISAIHPV